MRTTKLYKISILGKNKDKKEIIEKLQSLGVVHITKATDEEKRYTQDSVQDGLDEISTILLNLRYVLETTGVEGEYEIKELPDFNRTLSETKEFIDKYVPIIKNIKNQMDLVRQDLSHKRSLLSTLASIPIDIEIPNGQNIILCKSSKEARLGKLKKKVNFKVSKITSKKEFFYILKTSKASSDRLMNLLNDEPVKVVDLSFVKENTKETKIMIRKEISKTKRTLAKLSEELSKQLEFDRTKLYYLIEVMEAFREQYVISSNFLKTKNFFLMKGFCEEKELERIKKNVPDVTIWAKKAKENAPTKLKNKKLTKNFEIITELFGTPTYNTIDPTPILAFFYPFFFGFMLSDIGYGILLMTGVLFLRYKFGEKMKVATKIFGLSAISSIIFGLIFGSFFGNLIYMNPIYKDSFSASFNILIMALVIGLIHINLGVILKAYQLLIKGTSVATFWKEVSPYPLIQATVCLLIVKQTLAACVVAIILVATLVWNKSIFGIMDITNFFGTWFSYARLLALSLATAGVALAVNIIAIKMLAVPYLGVVLWLLVLIGGHSFNFLLNVLGCSIHAARLHYVEFFSLFFEGEGYKFTPFSIRKETTT